MPVHKHTHLSEGNSESKMLSKREKEFKLSPHRHNIVLHNKEDLFACLCIEQQLVVAVSYCVEEAKIDA